MRNPSYGLPEKMRVQGPCSWRGSGARSPGVFFGKVRGPGGELPGAGSGGAVPPAGPGGAAGPLRLAFGNVPHNRLSSGRVPAALGSKEHGLKLGAFGGGVGIDETGTKTKGVTGGL